MAVEELTIKTTFLNELPFDHGGRTARILFVPIRPRKFRLRVEGRRTRGMVGNFVVE